MARERKVQEEPRLRWTWKLQTELDEIVREREIKRKLVYLGKSLSFKDYIFRKIHYVIFDYLSEKGVTRWECLRYFNFAKWCLARALNDGLEFLDTYFDIAEAKFMERDGLKPELVRDVEILLINYINDLPRLRGEYEQVKRWYDSYIEELKKRRGAKWVEHMQERGYI